MANASVDKLKTLMLLHGEKALVATTAALFVAFAIKAFLTPTLPIKPEQLQSAATSADANLQKRQDPKDILARLEASGIKDPDFEKMVENQQANLLKPADYRVKLDWVTPEPGAGLIRDQPELIAPTEVAAFPGRGGILMYALNEKGERIVDAASTEPKKAPRKKRRAPSMANSSMPNSSSSAPASAPPPENPEEAKKRAAIEAEKLKKMFSGKVEPAAKEKAGAKAEEAAPEPQGPWKEETRGKRWVVITGVIDNEQLKKNWLLALKNPAIAYPNYKRLDVERQVRQSDKSWSEWAAIDRNKSYEILDNLPELDAEYVPESKRPEALNDPLPYLKAGYWTGVHVARLVPSELRSAPKAAPTAPGAFPGLSMSSGISSSMPSSSSMPGMSMGSGMMGGSGGEGSVGADEANFTKIEDPALMIRSLDFTVDPDSTYRFRVRIVVVNPNKDHTDVNPGVDVESKELLGPWSEPSDEVTLPADVAAYAQAPVQTERRHDQVAFQVIRWDPATGQTVVKNDDAGPGEIVGEEGMVQMPSSDGGGAKMSRIDFNSRSIVLDTMGGREKLPDIGVERNQFEVPAVAMVVQADGSVAVKSQDVDMADEVRDDMETNYHQALNDSGDKRKPGGGSRMPVAGKKKRKGP